MNIFKITTLSVVLISGFLFHVEKVDGSSIDWQDDPDRYCLEMTGDPKFSCKKFSWEYLQIKEKENRVKELQNIGLITALQNAGLDYDDVFKKDMEEIELLFKKIIIQELEELNVRHYPQQYSIEHLKNLLNEERQRLANLKKSEDEEKRRITEEKERLRRESDKELEKQLLLEEERERIREIVRQELEEEIHQSQPINNQTVQTNTTPPTSQPVMQQSLQEENINIEEMETSSNDILDDKEEVVEEIKEGAEERESQNIFQRVRFRISNFFSGLF